MIAIEETSDVDKGLVLIVDDLPENVLLIDKTLIKKGYRTIVVNNGMDALIRAKENKPDLILLDILMPLMDGFEICERLKSDPDTERIPVIFLTALNDINYIVNGFSSGGVDYITKPFNIPELLARIKIHIELKQLHDSNTGYINKLYDKNRELSEARQKLTELNTQKDKFFSILAHDLKNPFQGLIKTTEYIVKNSSSLEKDEIVDTVNDLHKSADSMFKLLENLLTWSRVQLGRITLEKTNQNLMQLVNNISSIFTENLKQKNIKLVTNINEQLVGYFDVNIIHTVLRNLLSNAIKFSFPNGTIEISARQSDENHIRVKVRDHGTGMTAEEIQKLFRIDTNKSIPGTLGEAGTGLGLVLCKELIEKNGGTIEVLSDKGQFTEFSFTIDLASEL